MSAAAAPASAATIGGCLDKSLDRSAHQRTAHGITLNHRDQSYVIRFKKTNKRFRMSELFAGLDKVRNIIDRDDAYTLPHLGRAVMKDDTWVELVDAAEALRETPHAQDTVDGFDWSAPASKARLQALLKQLESPWRESSIVGFSGVHEHAFLNRTEALRDAFCRGQADHQPDTCGRSPLLVACMSGAEESARFLLDSGACQQPDDEGRSPLHVAAAFGSAAICEMLIARGAKVNSMDSRGRTPLHGAADRGQRRVCELLIARGALHAEDDHDNTPLMLAARACKPQTCAALIWCGAKVNAVDEEACSPLMLAAAKGSFATCKVLIEAGADVNYYGRYEHGRSRRAQQGPSPSSTCCWTAARRSRATAAPTARSGVPCSSRRRTDGSRHHRRLQAADLQAADPIKTHMRYCTMRDCVSANRAAALEHVVVTNHVTMQGMVVYERGLTNSSQDRSSLLCCAAEVGDRVARKKRVPAGARQLAEGFLQGLHVRPPSNLRADVRRPRSPRGSHLDFTTCVDHPSRNTRPIQLAAMFGQTAVCTWLVNQGVHPDSAAAGTRRPLRLAADKYNPHTCAALLRAGADPGEGWNLCGFRTGGTIHKWTSHWSRTDQAIVLAALPARA